MDRNHSLVYVLSAIVLLNIVAIVILQGRTAETEVVPEITPPEIEAPAPIVVEQEQKPVVKVLVLEDDCSDCFDVRLYLGELTEALEMDVQDGPSGVFTTARLPALAFSQEIEEYPSDYVDGWEYVGEIVEFETGEYAGKWYVLPTMNPPYVDTTTGEVVGRVSVTYLTMNACEDCYDVSLNDIFLEESRIIPYEKKIVDIDSDEGKTLLNIYDITAVPTILLSKDADAYANIKPGWPLVGTVEPDGTYVLRDLQRLQVTYYDLEREEVMSP